MEDWDKYVFIGCGQTLDGLETASREELLRACKRLAHRIGIVRELCRVTVNEAGARQAEVAGVSPTTVERMLTNKPLKIDFEDGLGVVEILTVEPS